MGDGGVETILYYPPPLQYLKVGTLSYGEAGRANDQQSFFLSDVRISRFVEVWMLEAYQVMSGNGYWTSIMALSQTGYCNGVWETSPYLTRKVAISADHRSDCYLC